MATIKQMICEPYISLFARLFVGMILLIASIAKLMEGSRFVEIVRGYQLLPERLVAWVGRLLPLWEIIVAFGLLTGLFQSWAALSALVLFLMFSGAILVNLMRGRYYISCGCFGSGKDQQLSWKLVVRNIVLGGIALLALSSWPPAGRFAPSSNAEMGPTVMIAVAAVACWWLSGVIIDLRRLPNLLEELGGHRTRK